MKSIYPHDRKDRTATTLRKYVLTTLPSEIVPLALLGEGVGSTSSKAKRMWGSAVLCFITRRPRTAGGGGHDCAAGWGSRLCCTTTRLPQDYHSIYIFVSNMANNWALDRCHQSCHPCTFQKILHGKELLVEQGQEKSQPKPAESEPPKFLNNCLLFAI